MGHYDNCRPENCSVCGQAQGYCEHTRVPHVEPELYIPPRKDKLMFRGTKKSEMSPKNFGVGSIVKEGNSSSWLVICRGKQVNLLDLKTFEVWGGGVTVEDPNFLSLEETRLVMKCLEGTFTDYDCDPKGMKK
jgi:hypothetical protein